MCLQERSTCTHSVGDDSPPNMQSAHSSQDGLAHRGTVCSISTPNPNGSYPVTENSQNTENASVTSTLHEQLRCSMTLAQSDLTARPQLGPSSAPPDSEASRTEKCESSEDAMQQCIDMLYQLVTAGKDNKSQLECELKFLRAQMRAVNGQKDDAEEKLAAKIKQLNDAELEVERFEYKVKQHSSGRAGEQVPACCRKGTVVKVSWPNWRELSASVEADPFEHVRLEAKKVGVARLEKDLAAELEKYHAIDAERSKCKAEIRKIEEALRCVEARKNVGVLDFEERGAKIGELKGQISDENPRVKAFMNRLAVIGAQHAETVARCKRMKAEFDKLHSERGTTAQSYEKQVETAATKNGEMQENVTNRVSVGNKSLAEARSSLDKAEQNAEADEDSLFGHGSGKLPQIIRENNSVQEQVEAKKKEIGEKDAMLDELAGEIGKLEFLSSETEKVLAMLHLVSTLPDMERFF